MIVVSIAGNVMQGSVGVSSTHLTSAIVLDLDGDGVEGEEQDDISAIHVASTEGFDVPGTIQIGDERFYYTKITATTFTEIAAQPMLRAQDDTVASYHATGTGVRSIEGSMLNVSISHNIATIADASGIWAVPTILLELLKIIGSLFILPLTFLGTDLEIIGIIWSALAAGMIVSLALSLAGGRRV